MGAIACVTLMATTMLILKKSKRNTHFVDITLELSQNMKLAYEKTYAEIITAWKSAQDTMEREFKKKITNLGTQSDSDLEKASGIIADIKQKQLAALEQTEKTTADLISHLETNVHDLQEKIKSTKDTVQTVSNDIQAAARQQAEVVLAQANEQAKQIVSAANTGYQTFLDEMKKDVSEQFEKGHTALLAKIQADEQKVIEQSQDTIKAAQKEAWNKVEQFNSKLLQEFDSVSEKIMQQSEERAKRIGDKVLKHVEEDIVAYIIGIVHETVEMTLTPEQHQGLIIKAVQNMKRKINLHDMQVAPEQKETIVEQPQASSTIIVKRSCAAQSVPSSTGPTMQSPVVAADTSEQKKIEPERHTQPVETASADVAVDVVLPQPIPDAVLSPAAIQP